MIVCNSEKDIFLFDYWKDYLALGYLVGVNLRSLGDETPKDLICSLDGGLHADTDESDFYRYYSLELIRITKIWKSGKHPSENPPSYYIDWALSKNIEIPWLDWAVENGYYTRKLNNDKQPQDLKPRERETMIKIIHALAVNGYKYPSHGSVKEIVQDFERNGNGVSEKTLKKYLDEAVAL